tara:strand:- start:6776 stop:7915 length:1140 start_codon:yes stop_codon:yes gene_type:complete
MYEDFISFSKDLYNDNTIPLHEPRFYGNEKKYLNDCIDSTFVSSSGKYLDIFEKEITRFTGARFAIATSNGTSALHISLLLSGVEYGHEVITQPVTFVATCNAIKYCGAEPIFIDIDKESLGLSPEALEIFLKTNCNLRENKCINKISGREIRACVPMHTFGHPCRIDEIKKICDKFHIKVVEDAAESLGSFFKNKHTGTFGDFGVISFNGNKIVTSGGGGCILTNDELLASKAKHITTTAKTSHPWEYYHDSIGYNYRMPNLNAALLVAQLENINKFLISKRQIAENYKSFFQNSEISFHSEPKNSKSNYWLNSILLPDKRQRDVFLKETNENGVLTRPVWTLMNKLNLFKSSQCGDLRNSLQLEKRIINIPSSVRKF